MSNGNNGERFIVIIDDNQANIELLSDHLTMENFEHQSFVDPEEALSYIIWIRPAAVIVDLHMPTMSGLELITKLREEMGPSAPPCLILSCDDSQQSMIQGFESGASDYLRKPFGHGELIAKLKRVIGQYKVPDFSPLPHQVPTVINGYEVLKELGRGGMGVVYKVKSTKIEDAGAIFALKAIHYIEQKATTMMRFRREIDLLTSLQHPNLSGLHAAGRLDNLIYFVMDYIEGKPLSHVRDNRGPVPAEEVGFILQRLLNVLHFIHHKNILHRDIKPDNIILSSDGEPYLIDFGLAKSLLDTQLTNHSQILGTISFMAPEQIRGEPLDERIDIFALGLTCLELLMGSLAVDGPNTYACVDMIIKGEYPRAQHFDHIPPSFALLIDRMICPRKEERFQNAAECLRALDAIRTDFVKIR
jgi:eukaryotic-like serine/threonine-protein kinase